LNNWQDPPIAYSRNVSATKPETTEQQEVAYIVSKKPTFKLWSVGLIRSISIGYAQGKVLLNGHY